jgi:hypothetical protein
VKFSLEFKLCNVVLRGTVIHLRCFNLSARVSKLIDLPASPLDGKHKNTQVELNIKLPPFHFWMLFPLLLRNKPHGTRIERKCLSYKNILGPDKRHKRILRTVQMKARFSSEIWVPLQDGHKFTWQRKQIFFVTSIGLSNKTNELPACTRWLVTQTINYSSATLCSTTK